MALTSLSFMQTIRFRLMATLCAVLALSMGAAMYGIWGYERDKFIEIGHKEATRAGRTIEKALRGAMLQNDRKAIQRAINEISEIVEPPSRLSILSNNGTVIFSSDATLPGAVFSREKDPSCLICHEHEGSLPNQNTIMIDSDIGPLLRNVIKIVNEPACHKCHAAAQKNLGILLYDALFQETFDMMRTVALRTFLTGLLTFLLMIVVLSYLVNRFIHQPIQALITGFNQVGKGDFSYWVEVEGSSEFSDMADSFNILSRAIGRYLEEIKAKSRETATFYAVVQRMSQTIELKELIRIIFDLFFEFFVLEEILLVQPEEKKEGCFAITWRNKRSERLHHATYSLKNRVFPSSTLHNDELQLWISGNIQQPLYMDNDTRVLIPLAYNTARVGLICLKKQAGRHVTSQGKMLIPALAHHVAISLANARLYHLATTDSLTGLYTKRYFQDMIMKFVEAGPDSAKPFWIMMLDLDHFKEVNDTYGHPAGDQVLAQTADLIRENIRYGDIPCRYGGEEFIILLPEIKDGAKSVQDIANRLLHSFAEHVFSCADCPPIHRTVSIGIASFPEHAATAEEIIQVADQALYEAKRGGRNQIRRAAPLAPAST